MLESFCYLFSLLGSWHHDHLTVLVPSKFSVIIEHKVHEAQRKSLIYFHLSALYVPIMAILRNIRPSMKVGGILIRTCSFKLGCNFRKCLALKGSWHFDKMISHMNLLSYRQHRTIRFYWKTALRIYPKFVKKFPCLIWDVLCFYCTKAIHFKVFSWYFSYSKYADELQNLTHPEVGDRFIQV